MIKKTYENPESELITVRFEEGFLTTSPGGYSDQGTSPNTGEDDDQGPF